MLATTLVESRISRSISDLLSFSISSSPSPSLSSPLSFPLEDGYSCGCITGLSLCTSWLDIKYSVSFPSYLGYQLVWVFVSPSPQLIYRNLIPNMTVVRCEAFSGWLHHAVGPPSDGIRVLIKEALLWDEVIMSQCGLWGAVESHQTPNVPPPWSWVPGLQTCER